MPVGYVKNTVFSLIYNEKRGETVKRNPEADFVEVHSHVNCHAIWSRFSFEINKYYFIRCIPIIVKFEFYKRI